MGHHAGQLHHLAELHFTPPTADARRTQRTSQVLRFQLQLLLRLADQAQHGPHAGAVVHAILLNLFQFGIDLEQRVLDRRDQRPQLLLAPGQVDGGFLVDVADLLVGELDELVGARLEGGCGERGE